MPGGGDAETVTVVRPLAKDTFGNRASGSSQRYDVPGCLFAPGPSQELNEGANQVDSDGIVYAPTEIKTIVPGGPKSTDQMEVRGDLYQVDGKPKDWGRTFGLEIRLRLVTG